MSKIYDSRKGKWVFDSKKNPNERLKLYSETVKKSFEEEYETTIKKKDLGVLEELVEICQIRGIEAEDVINEYEAYCSNSSLDCEKNIIDNISEVTCHFNQKHRKQQAKEREKLRQLDVEKRVEKKLGVDVRDLKRHSISLEQEVKQLRKSLGCKDQEFRELRQSLTLITERVGALEEENKQLKRNPEKQFIMDTPSNLRGSRKRKFEGTFTNPMKKPRRSSIDSLIDLNMSMESNPAAM